MNPEKPSFSDPLLNLPRKVFGWLFSWRTMRRCLIGLAVLITLVALGLTEEHWRGKRAWQKFKAEQEAKGEPLDLAAFLPPPVPDEQNFLMTPLLAPLFDCRFDPVLQTNVWRNPQAVERLRGLVPDQGKRAVGIGNRRMAKRIDLAAWQAFYQTSGLYPKPSQPQSPAADVLLALTRFEAELAELRGASQRPYAQFKARREDALNVPFLHYGVMKTLARTLTLRAVAELQSQRSDDALADVLVSYRLADSLQKEPTLMALLVRVALMELTVQAVWEGLIDHQWSEPQLIRLQEKLRSLDLLKDYRYTMRGERAYGNAMLERMQPLHSLWARTVLGGFYYQNQLALNQLYPELAVPIVDVERHYINISLLDQHSQKVKGQLTGYHPYTIFAKMLIPAFSSSAKKVGAAQATIDQALVACALERYRLANGQYPETLAALTPQFLAKVPPDLMDGKPMRYRREADGTYVLYSVGLNGKDDGGIRRSIKDEVVTPTFETRYGLQPRNNLPKSLTTNLPEGVAIARRGAAANRNNTEDDWVWQFPAK